MSQRGSAALRTALYQAASMARLHEPRLGEIYNRHKHQMNKHHGVAISHVARTRWHHLCSLCPWPILRSHKNRCSAHLTLYSLSKADVCVPAEFRQWCHGYVVTSHKAQGWTADHVVVAAERLTAKGACVACSRDRKSCIIHTPDKERLVERLPEGNRCAALDVLSEISTTNAPTLNRVSAWKQLAAYLASQIARRLNQSLADGVHAQHVSDIAQD